MAQRGSDVEITIFSARDLKNVNWKKGELRAFATAWVDPEVKVTTKIDEGGDTDPRWDEKFTLPVTKPLEEAVLTIEIYHDRSSDLKKPLVGTAKLQLMELADEGGLEEKQDYTLKLLRPSGRPHGKLEITARLRERRWPAQGQYGGGAPGYGQPYYQGGAPGQTRDWQGYGPYTPYPQYGQQQGPPAAAYNAPYGAAAPAGYPPYGGYPAAASGYPQAPSGYPQAPSGYPPAGAGYGSSSYGAYQGAPAGEAQKKGSKLGGLGMGLAVGAVAGAVGGIALDEFIDHKEDEAAEEQREEDDERYAEVENAREDDYYSGDGGGDDY